MIPKPPEHFTTVTRRRRAAGEYIAGRWVDGAASDADIVASVQPATGKDLLRLPEGLRTRDAIAILTDDDLRTANETERVPADRIVYLGEEYEVHSVEHWSMGAVDQLGHRDCVAVRADRAGAPIPP